MSTVYKYCDKCGVDILKTLEIKITPANQFNDPYELLPYVICSDVEGEAINIIETEDDFLNEEYRKVKESGEYGGNFSEFKKLITSDLMPTIPNMATNLQANYDLIRSRFGVLCLCKKRNSVVMFEHYGDKHHGLVIGFDSSHAIFRKGAGLQLVNYVPERVVYDKSWKIIGGEQEGKFAEALIFSKNEEWEYEHEVRQIFQLFPPHDECLTKKPFIDKRSGKEIDGYFYPIPPEAFVSVSLGTKSLPELEKQVELVLQNKHLSHVKLDRARLHDSKFELTFECI